MNKCKKFLDFFDELIDACHLTTIPEDVQDFYDMLKSSQNNYSEKPAFTENGLLILEYLQSNDIKSIKAREIADGLCKPSRTISGAMKKLVNDGYVEKFGQNPVIYALTEKGKNFNLKEYKENLKNTCGQN